MSIADEAIKKLGLARKEHGVISIIISHSFGTINGILTHEEDALSPEELAYKHEKISDGVINDLWGSKENPGEVREMKNDFTVAMEAAGGDLEKAFKEHLPWKKGQGQAKGKAPNKKR